MVICKIEERFTISESSVNLPTGITPFSISADQWIVLLFTVQPDMKGYFTLNVTCLDKGESKLFFFFKMRRANDWY